LDMCVTSPPYWGLRDYEMDEQLGLESTPEEFINNLCDIFDEVQRVLRPHGSCWVNLGDSYVRNPSQQDPQKGINSKYNYNYKHKKNYGSTYRPKSLVQIPSRFAIEMTNRGWILRNEIIWHKPSCMPASVKDRYTVDFEKMFFFTKNPKYYFKQQLEPVKEVSLKRAQYGLDQTDYDMKAVNVQGLDKMGERFVNPNGRNKRTVWNVNVASFKGAHFAVYPPELIESPIDAGCPEFVDKKTGIPRERVMEKTSLERHELPKDNPNHRPERYDGKYEQGQRYATYDDKGYTDGRDDDEFTPGIVLDPFFGSGTTAEVAMKQDKDWVGIELNPEFVKISDERLEPTKIEKKTRDKSKEFWK
jgi:DNA modification methylase